MSSVVDLPTAPWSSSSFSNRGGDVYKPVSFKPQQSTAAAADTSFKDKFGPKNAVWSPTVVNASSAVANGNVTSLSSTAECPSLKGPNIWKPATLPKATAAVAENYDDVHSESLSWKPAMSLQQEAALSDGQDVASPSETTPKLSVRELRQMWSGVPTMMTDGGHKGHVKVKAPSSTTATSFANTTAKSAATITFAPSFKEPIERPTAFVPPPPPSTAAAAAVRSGWGGTDQTAVDVQVSGGGGGGSRGSSVFRELENCLSDEWWDSLFATYNVDNRDSKPATNYGDVTRPTINHGVVTNGVPPYDTTPATHTYSFKPSSANEKTAVTNSTAAVLRLSNVLQKAPAGDVTRPNNLQGLNSAGGGNKRIPPPTLPKDREKIGMSNSAILQQWKADLNVDLNASNDSSNRIGPRTEDYQRRKIEVTKTPSNAKDTGFSDRPKDSGNQVTSDNNSNTPKPVKFDGIGPTDSETGVPIATRTSIDEASRKDWYRCMYKSLHKVDKPTEVNPFLSAAYVLTEPNSPTRRDGDFSALGSPNSAIVYSADRDFDQFWYPTDAKYRPQRYKNQPRRIEDYEPGRSSLALKQVKTCESERLLENVRFAESDAEADYRTSSEKTANDESRRNNRNSSRKPVRSIDGHTFRQHWDNQNRRRRDEVERVIEAERRKRFANEQKAMEAQRHSDFLTPAEKSSILLNRFEDDETLQTADSLERPEYRSSTKTRGKARALYNFRAQNARELTLKKGDTVYLLRQVDHNWYKGEKHGSVGIFPVSYVEVLLSLDEAQVAAGLKEGRAYAKYNFKGLTNKELSLHKGDIVKLVRRIDDNWYEARVNGRQGIVPEIYIELLREPETPFITPMSSRAATPLLGNSCGISPASSVISLGGPEIPSAPISPWMSDFYDSEIDTDRSPVTSLRKRKPDIGKVSQASLLLAPSKPKLAPKSATNYLNFRSQNILDQGPYGWPASSQPSTLERAAANQRKKSEPRDLFELAQSRRKQGSGEPWDTGLNTRSQSLPRGQNVVGNQGTLRAKSSSPAVVRKQLATNIVPPSPVYNFERCRALFPYTPRHIDELELQQGDLVEVMEKCDDGWYVGTSVRTNEFGTFPGNYVKPEN